jgi:hypothetical protein
MRQTYASPMSFVGGTRRMTTWAGEKTGGMSAFAWTAAVLGLPMFWIFLIVWYFVVFGLFGLFTIPFRFFRRGQRKSLALQQEQLELMRQSSRRER